LRLLRDLRAAQTRLVEIADTPSEALTEEIIGPSLGTFLFGLRAERVAALDALQDPSLLN
jgi:hypothetical protein